ncbi:hypothetical protein M501DRAFT_1016043 [Patellaria atrata CBS 101060]|uniref:Uncharacterized protein n=1 Tax=Patellaria atrata CBS 101060 TaxID=1346257 RepID=A0A9P4SE58_9PEZI|nr:hypothetical protein M501DRAFT_1016043 [Patellaria atrata CBS 101060]
MPPRLSHSYSLSLLSRKVGSVCHKSSTSCKPATKKQTFIIAICAGVGALLVLLLVLWWYRCCCCCSRRGDKRSVSQRIKDGFSGWKNGGQRPAKGDKAGTYEKVDEGASAVSGAADVDTSYSSTAGGSSGGSSGSYGDGGAVSDSSGGWSGGSSGGFSAGFSGF